MNLSYSEIITCLELLKDYINPLPIIFWGILGMVTGVLLMIIILIILRKKILVNRRHRLLKVLARTYLIILPLWAGFNFMQWFALHGCEREITKNIPKYLGETNVLFNKYVKEYVTGIISENYLGLTGHEVIDKTVNYAGDLLGSVIREVPSESVDVADQISGYLLAHFAGSDFFKNSVIDKLEEYIGKPLLMDKKLTRELLDVKIQNLLDDGIMNTILTKQVNKVFGGIKKKCVIRFPVGAGSSHGGNNTC